jgi:hypothetical protein
MLVLAPVRALYRAASRLWISSDTLGPRRSAQGAWQGEWATSRSDLVTTSAYSKSTTNAGVRYLGIRQAEDCEATISFSVRLMNLERIPGACTRLVSTGMRTSYSHVRSGTNFFNRHDWVKPRYRTIGQGVRSTRGAPQQLS